MLPSRSGLSESRSPALASFKSITLSGSQLADDTDHFQRAECSFSTLVARFGASAFNSLLNTGYRQYTKGDGHRSIKADMSQAFNTLASHIIKVWSTATNHSTQR